MKTISLTCALWLAIALDWQAKAQTYDTNNVVVQTFAGSGFSGYVDGQGTQTMFNNPSAVVADTSSNLFVLDYGNSRIRKIAPDGSVSTFVGGGAGSLPGYGTNVSLYVFDYTPMTIDHSNTLWLANSSGSLVRIRPDAYVSATNLHGVIPVVYGVCVDSGNNVYLSGEPNKIYRYRTNGVLEVFAGSGNPGAADGNGIFTSFYFPAALAADAADNIYVWDRGNRLVRRINQNGDVVTVAGKSNGADADGFGTNALFSSIASMCVDDSGNLILACGFSIRKITAATNVTTIAGSFGQCGNGNGAGSVARFACYTTSSFGGVCASQGMIFVADGGNHRIRSITFDAVPEPVWGGNLDLNIYPGLKITGVIGRTYRIESSSLVNTNWATETTILLTASPYLWIDPNKLGQKKFYRAFLLP